MILNKRSVEIWKWIVVVRISHPARLTKLNWRPEWQWIVSVQIKLMTYWDISISTAGKMNIIEYRCVVSCNHYLTLQNTSFYDPFPRSGQNLNSKLWSHSDELSQDVLSLNIISVKLDCWYRLFCNYINLTHEVRWLNSYSHLIDSEETEIVPQGFCRRSVFEGWRGHNVKERFQVVWTSYVDFHKAHLNRDPPDWSRFSI